MKITINVTHEDIRNGRPKSCNSCPIALSIKRDLQVQRIEVAKGYLKIWRHSAIEFYRLPDVAYEFYTAFDDNKSVSPFSFDLELENKLHLCGSGPVRWEKQTSSELKAWMPVVGALKVSD